MQLSETVYILHMEDPGLNPNTTNEKFSGLYVFSCKYSALSLQPQTITGSTQMNVGGHVL